MDRVCSHCDRMAAVIDARNEKTSAGISADGACGRTQPLMRTARLRPTNEMEETCLTGQPGHGNTDASDCVVGRENRVGIKNSLTWPTREQ